MFLISVLKYTLGDINKAEKNEIEKMSVCPCGILLGCMSLRRDL